MYILEIKIKISIKLVNSNFNSKYFSHFIHPQLPHCCHVCISCNRRMSASKSTLPIWLRVAIICWRWTHDWPYHSIPIPHRVKVSEWVSACWRCLSDKAQINRQNQSPIIQSCLNKQLPRKKEKQWNLMKFWIALYYLFLNLNQQTIIQKKKKIDET